MLLKLLSFLLMILFLVSCAKQRYKGHRLSKPKQKKVEEQNSNFNQEQAEEIIEYTSKKKKKREKQAEKDRQKQQEKLEALNEEDEDNKAENKPVKFDFY